MKSSLLLHRAFLPALLVCLASPLLSHAAETTSRDRAAELLARQGTVEIVAAGPFVEAGTFRVQVAAKLGQPDLKLADGTWLYHHHTIEGSSAEGTLVVRFTGKGRVSSLALVTPALVAALRDNAARPAASPLVAVK